MNPAYLAGVAAPLAPAATCWSSRSPGGFAINLAPAMRAELLTPVQALPLRPDFGHAEAPLVLPADACLRVSCGEVAFDCTRPSPRRRCRAPRFGAVCASAAATRSASRWRSSRCC